MELNKELAIKHCKELIRLNGKCYDLNCTDCPGKSSYNNNKNCQLNGWRMSNFVINIDLQTVTSARKWLAIHDKPLTNIYSEEE
jgi:hypothetical protein